MQQQPMPEKDKNYFQNRIYLEMTHTYVEIYISIYSIAIPIPPFHICFKA